MKYHIITKGMGCPHCIARVTNAVKALNAEDFTVELNSIDVEYKGDIEEVKKSIEALGFEVISVEAK